MTFHWPWVSAARYDDMLREKNMQIGRLEKELSDLKKESKRQHDLIYKANFGVQVYDTIPEVQPEPEPQLTPEQQAEKQVLEEAAREELRLRSIARTNPSQLGYEIARLRKSSTLQAAKAANPGAQAFVTELNTIAHNGHNAN